jgi:hypothetical protein
MPAIRSGRRAPHFWLYANQSISLLDSFDTDYVLILGSFTTYRIAIGPQQGRKAFMIRTIRPLDKPDPGLERVAEASGFSLVPG